MDPNTSEVTQDTVSIESQEPKKKNTLYIEILLESLIVVVIIAGIVGGFAYFKIISLGSIFSSKQPGKTNTFTPPNMQKTTTTSSNNLPIDPAADGVGSAITYYTIISPITSLIRDATGTHVTFAKIPTIPFDLSVNTKVSFASTPTKIVGSGALQSADTVSVSLLYNNKSKDLQIVKIDILNRKN